MITGFLKNNRMEPSTGRRNVGGVPARRAWIPLKERETVLMMHEIAVGCINVTKFDHRKNQGSWFRKKDQYLLEDLHQQDCGFPLGRYLHFSCR